MATTIPNAWTMVASFRGGGNTWTQSLDVTSHQAIPGIAPESTDPIVDSFIAFMRFMSIEAVQLTQVALYFKRAGKGSLPIAQTLPLWVRPVNQPGNRDLGFGTPTQNTPLDLEGIAYLRKINQGRVGRLFMRAFLYEGDVQAVGGGFWTFSDQSGNSLANKLVDVLDNTIRPYFAGQAVNYAFCVVHVRLDENGAVLESQIKDIQDMSFAYAGWHRRKRN